MGGAEGCKEGGRGRGMRGSRAWQRDVKKVGVVVDLYNRFIAFKNGFKEKDHKIANFFEGFEAIQSLHCSLRMVLQKKR